MPGDDKNKSSYELLLKATREGNLEVVKFLLDNGANIEAKDERGQNPSRSRPPLLPSPVISFLSDYIRMKQGCFLPNYVSLK